MSCIPSSPTLVCFQPEDDIDSLFRQLPQIEPSGELIARILTHVRHLPGPLFQREQREPSESTGVNALIVHNEQRDPS